MGQPGRISVGQAVTLIGLAARPGCDRVTGPGQLRYMHVDPGG